MYKKLFKRARDEAGNVAMIFALSIVPIFGVAGFAIDLQNTVKQKHRMQVILDSAVLAAARVKQRGGSDDEITKSLQDFVAMQMAPISTGLNCRAANVSVVRADDLITANIICAQNTSLTRVIGHEKMDFAVASTAEYGIDKLDVAFMFDISGSMNSRSRLVNLKAAAKEAVDILLPPSAPPELIKDTRLSMVSYNTMVNAGDYFQAVTGVPATRTYTHTIDNSGAGASPDQGDLLDNLEITLMDTDRSREMTQFGDNAVIAIEDWTARNRTEQRLSVDVKVPRTSSAFGRFQSMRMELRGPTRHNQVENIVPYALYGDRRGRYNGQQWPEGEYSLRIRVYSQRRARGRKLIDETIEFEVVRSEDAEPVELEYTLTSTCVWERDGAEKFTDGAPGAGAYLAHRQAWFVEDEDHRDGGSWQVGHPNRPDHSWYRGTECRGTAPVGLTNDRDTLNRYVDRLSAGGGTAGHLGVAWSWYLISENWDGVFTGTSAPLSYSEPDSDKVVILMTDGEFNAEIYPEQGSSDAQARALCDGMKASGVTVYTVALDAPLAGRRVLQYCASGPEFFHQPKTAAELTEAYKQIATSISDLRISQ
ncbi:MAG: pilus assembly protein TadG-related protein [Pseudomonadota bacterium]